MGILEAFRKKYPDYNVTATFFMNSRLFQNGDDDARIIQWMVDNGYDIGNHTYEHPNLSECTYEEIAAQVGKMYEMLEGIIQGQYVNIIAPPYGVPTDVTAAPKYDAIFHCDYNGNLYETKATLLCSWTRENSPFHKDFDLTYVKRIRGYDHDGTDFDIEQNFAELNGGRRYISDGDPSTIVIHEADKEWLGGDHGLTVITY